MSSSVLVRNVSTRVLYHTNVDNACQINFHRPTDRPTFLSIFLLLRHSIDVKQQCPRDISSLLPDSNFASNWVHQWKQNFWMTTNRKPWERVGGLPYERGGDARRKFWIKPLKETSVGVAGLNLFFTLKAIILNFDYMNRVNKTNWKYISFWYFIECNPKRDLYG